MWFIYAMEYYSAINNEDILSFAGKGMELEKVIIFKSQLQSLTDISEPL